jgi:YesN/AraC family two-component response regulator
MIILLLAGFIALSCIIYLFVYKKRNPVIEEQTSESASASRELFQRICRLMDEERLYLNSELKVSDISQRLGTNKRYVSDCIKLHKGCAFSYFVNTYRIEYAKQLLRQNPEKKMTTISWESGFANDTTFFRTFKAFTNMTPKEWLSQND